MKVDIQFPDSLSDRVFLTWRPIKATARVIDAPAGQPSVAIRLEGKSNVGGGAIAFANRLTHASAPSIDLQLPSDGTPVDVWIGGAFPNASKAFGDVSVEARQIIGGQPVAPLLGRVPVMVRIRKNAEALTNAERDLFLSAMAALNGKGTGRFVDFRDMHDGDAYEQIHVNISFLPWHRAYLLDIERELQTIEDQIALPYWKFDEAAPKLFQRSFIGQSDQSATVQFALTNPLRNWVGDLNRRGIWRGNSVGPTTVIDVRNEFDCMRISDGPGANFTEFSDWSYTPTFDPTGLESDPHNGAHGNHGAGWITNPTTSQLDPLFYLLHTNVDRLWAKWQWLPSGSGGARSDPAANISYFTGPPRANGHNRGDTLWPWDGIVQPGVATRPPTAPGGGMADSSMTRAPGLKPLVRSMIDYLGAHGGDHLGFAYDDVPFEL